MKNRLVVLLFACAFSAQILAECKKSNVVFENGEYAYKCEYYFDDSSSTVFGYDIKNGWDNAVSTISSYMMPEYLIPAALVGLFGVIHMAAVQRVPVRPRDPSLHMPSRSPSLAALSGGQN